MPSLTIKAVQMLFVVSKINMDTKMSLVKRLDEALQYNPLKFSTFARYNGKIVVILQFGDQESIIRSLHDDQAKRVPTQDLIPWESSDRQQPVANAMV